jgi:hypothetical protein
VDTVAVVAQPTHGSELAYTGYTGEVAMVGGGLLAVGVLLAVYARRLKVTYGRLWVKR